MVTETPFDVHFPWNIPIGMRNGDGITNELDVIGKVQ